MVIALARSGNTLFYRVDHQEQVAQPQPVSRLALTTVFIPLIIAVFMVLAAQPLTAWLENTSQQIKNTPEYIRQALNPAVSRLHQQEPQLPELNRISPHSSVE